MIHQFRNRKDFNIMTKKEISQNFLRLASKGESREAFQLYVGNDFKHHNAYFKGDGHTLMIAMEESARKNPNKIFEIQRALEDGDLVAVHSRVQQAQGDLEIAVIHIFRFDKDKIVELWDFGQPVTSDIVNENGMF
jgi:predicted SnoaL-like aldol condensation-catalyzing enzyme